MSKSHEPGFRPIEATGAARNAPCPCGSGVKTKKCCGAAHLHSDAHKRYKEALRQAFVKRAEERAAEEEECRKKGVLSPRRPAASLISLAALLASGAIR